SAVSAVTTGGVWLGWGRSRALHAQPGPTLQLRFAAMQVSPHALPVVHTRQQLRVTGVCVGGGAGATVGAGGGAGAANASRCRGGGGGRGARAALELAAAPRMAPPAP